MAQRKRNIEFANPDEPAFLKKMKAKIGFQGIEKETVETKKEKLSKDALNDFEDEQPVFVVPEDSDITPSEVDRFKDKLKEENEFKKESELPKRIIFKKPSSSSEDKKMQAFQSTKKSSTEVKNNDAKSKSILAKKVEIKSIKNSSLLSFGDEDEEED